MLEASPLPPHVSSQQCFLLREVEAGRLPTDNPQVTAQKGCHTGHEVHRSLCPDVNPEQGTLEGLAEVCPHLPNEKLLIPAAPLLSSFPNPLPLS